MSANIKQYLFAFAASQKFADEMEIEQYPVDMFHILGHLENVLISSFHDYKIWAQNNGRECPDELKEAKCYYEPDSNIYIIVYNEKKPQIRIRFSLAHELGHIVLGHLDNECTEIERGGLNNSLYYTMEGAANTFAGNFLAPPILIYKLLAGKTFDVNSVAEHFYLSKQAVRGYRKQDYQYWLSLRPTKVEKRILSRCKRRYYMLLCPRCGYYFSIRYAAHCPICGIHVDHKKLEDKEIMGRTYPNIELNKNGQVNECLLCKNVEHFENASFCMICGKPIINNCTLATGEDCGYTQCDHTEPLPGNARYCPYCGSVTTFFAANCCLHGMMFLMNRQKQYLLILAI